MDNRFLLVIDLEATCWENRMTPAGEPQTIHNMEIIEFGCALANRNGELLDSRSFLVQPTRNPQLKEFCTSLTSITQSMINTAPAFPEVCQLIDAWLGQPHEDFIWCSWGNYDRLHIQADGEKHGAFPVIMKYPHLNLKRIWRRTTGQKRKNGMIHALEYHGLALEGHHHRGIDDARNMVRLLPYMDWSLEEELLTPPSGFRSQGSVASDRVVSIEEMDSAIREKAGE
ncbi:MAG: exonuclease domain-containing protein [Marinobacter sp.]|uniref:3'-5' exonuclease n=1 Tax=Marinobacter sp. TaxID=50741 RepID=UPI001B6D20FE|nr:3'-5' exonuclease [Marinobacter sp.]MBQ0747389.1 exonuclease domain-containing protein [Marinobacter sp.]MBQ0814679.1 exonuclease domain-containing protein [Marinobacter sp.]|tara:strand:- start:385 stop:1068 length:684 start_codon:yes stop_codon:yes gene_type:complete